MASLQLYRNLLRETKLLTDYNFRNYAARRARLGFEQAKTVSHPEIAYQEGLEALQILKRQAAISQMFPSSGGFVMDSFTAHAK
eukprot:CAMPEP_0171728132 /NCGR_PEP_ID=MMETSP0991-20121206/26760_1 /TAXON_ID=483369 /ORGANISM="non described non described, Strain CCMP2098" /LENGTH=83 /DNA_ID=CAMNT_0012322109 /DNA_START=24 /DNA_END=275 /DNA_ORIENTATION=-